MAFDVEATAKRIGHYKWIEMRLFEVLGAWVPTVPEPEVKVRLGTHGQHHAWHAELWHKGLPDLWGRDPDRFTVPPSRDLVTFVDALGEPQEPDLTVEKLVGVYRVLVPHKVAAYTYHLDNTSPVTDGPTIRWLELVLRDEVDHWREGEMMLQSLIRSPEEVERAALRQANLEKLLVAAGGIAGRDTLG